MAGFEPGQSEKLPRLGSTTHLFYALKAQTLAIPPQEVKPAPAAGKRKAEKSDNGSAPFAYPNLLPTFIYYKN